MMSWSICSGCQTAADLPSVFTFLPPPSLARALATYAGWFSLWARTDAPPHPQPVSYPTPLTNRHQHLGILAMHSLQAAAGPQRRAWYTRRRETRNPMQFKSERSSGVKIAPDDTLSIVREWDTCSFYARKAWEASLKLLCFNSGQWGSKVAPGRLAPLRLGFVANQCLGCLCQDQEDTVRASRSFCFKDTTDILCVG